MVIYVVYLGNGFGTPTGYVEGHSILCGLFYKPFKGSLYSKDPGALYRMYHIMCLFFSLPTSRGHVFFPPPLGASGNPKRLD